MMRPPENAIPIGPDHYVTFVTRRDGSKAGIYEWHRDPQGQWCAGYILFAQPHESHTRPSWTVESEQPLTLSPSVLCRACNNHGWIREGRWVPA